MRRRTTMQPRPSPNPNPNQVRSADERTDHNAASSEPKRRSRHADPMDDVPALVEAFVSSGHIVPLGVHVAEVQALQQAATRLKVAAETCEHQLKHEHRRVCQRGQVFF